jgi:hypothetical protein
MNVLWSLGLRRALILFLDPVLAGPLTGRFVLTDFQAEHDAATLVLGAEGYGPVRDDILGAGVLMAGEMVG